MSTLVKKQEPTPEVVDIVNRYCHDAVVIPSVAERDKYVRNMIERPITVSCTGGTDIKAVPAEPSCPKDCGQCGGKSLLHFPLLSSMYRRWQWCPNLQKNVLDRKDWAFLYLKNHDREFKDIYIDNHQEWMRYSTLYYKLEAIGKKLEATLRVKPKDNICSDLRDPVDMRPPNHDQARIDENSTVMQTSPALQQQPSTLTDLTKRLREDPVIVQGSVTILNDTNITFPAGSFIGIGKDGTPFCLT